MKKKLLSLLSALLVVALTFCVTYVHPDAIRTDVPPSSQDDYPVLPEDQSNALRFPTSFEQLNMRSEVVFRGTVVEELGTQELSWDEGLKYPLSFEFETYRIRVDDVIRGSIEQEIILERNTMYSPSSPVLKEGTDMLFLVYRSDRGTYFPTNGDLGYYYIAEDNRVYPTRVDDTTRAYSGMSLLDFKKEVRRYSYHPPYSPTYNP